MKSLRIDLLRHGQVDVPPGLYGRTDVPLSATGWQQLQAAVRTLSNTERILYSPMQRCAAFACYWSQQTGITALSEPAFQEMDFGLWDGLAYDDRFPWEDVTPFWQNPSQSHPPQGECFSTFERRVLDAWQRLMRGPCQNLAILTHAGVIRTLLAHVLGVPATTGCWHQSLGIDYGSCSRIRVDQQNEGLWYRVEYINLKAQEITDISPGKPDCTKLEHTNGSN